MNSNRSVPLVESPHLIVEHPGEVHGERALAEGQVSVEDDDQDPSSLNCATSVGAKSCNNMRVGVCPSCSPRSGWRRGGEVLDDLVPSERGGEGSLPGQSHRLR